MKIRGVILVILLILSSASIMAFEEIFSEYVYTLDTFEVGDDIFYTALANDEEVLVLYKNQDTIYYIYNGTCQDTAYYQYCFMGTKLDYEDYGRPIPNTMQWEPALLVEIYSKKPDVEITRIVDNTEINRDGKVFVQIRIVNDGKLDISELFYEEQIPDNVVISSMSSSLIAVNNKITWSRPILTKEDEVIFSYTLKPTSYESIVLSGGNLSYIYEESYFSEKPKSKTISINTPFKKSSSVSKSKAGINEEFTYLFSVTNEDWQDRLDFDFYLKIPTKVEVVEIPRELDFSNNIVTYDIKLAPGETKNIDIVLKSNFEENITLKEKTSYLIRDELSEENKDFNVSITIPHLVADLKLSKTDIFEGTPFTLSVVMENSAEISFNDISGLITSNMFSIKTIDYPGIGAAETREVFKQVIPAIAVDNETTFNVTLKGTYKSPKYQLFNFEETETITVKPVTIGFEIKKTASKTELYPNQNITINVKVENLGQKISLISLKENIPEYFQVTSGLTEKILSLDANVEEEFYIFKLKVSPETPQGVYNITTMLDYEEGLITKEETLELIVRRNETKIVEEVVKEEEVEVEEKKGFWRTLIDFFTNFFK